MADIATFTVVHQNLRIVEITAGLRLRGDMDIAYICMIVIATIGMMVNASMSTMEIAFIGIDTHCIYGQDGHSHYGHV